MPCTVDPTPEEIRQSIEATRQHEKDIRNTINNLADMLCTMCRIQEENGRALPSKIHDWYLNHQREDEARLQAARNSARKKLTDEEIEAIKELGI